MGVTALCADMEKRDGICEHEESVMAFARAWKRRDGACEREESVMEFARAWKSAAAYVSMEKA